MCTNITLAWERPLTRILMQDFQDIHDAVESSPLVARMREANADRRDYMCYLVQVHADVAVYEDHLLRLRKAGVLAEPLTDLDLRLLYRKEAMNADITAWSAIVDPVAPTGCAVEHRTHFNTLAQRAPERLVAHAAVRYLAVLFGGQDRLQRLRRMWGPEVPSASYQFDRPIAEVRVSFCEQLDYFFSMLNPNKRQGFYEELITAWEFAAHLIEGDVSELAQNHRKRHGLSVT